jgi:FkbM family methyltransferase
MKKYISRSRNIGFLNFIKYSWFKKVKISPWLQFKLHVKGYPHPLFCRRNSTDIDVFKHVFVLKEYEFLSKFKGISTIVDCGANVGFSSVYFLHQLMPKRIIAIEPEYCNYKQLQKNLQPFQGKCQILNSAIWSSSMFMEIKDYEFGDGRDWAKAVEPSEGNKPTGLKSLGMRDVQKILNGEEIDILKMDVEGAEKEIFSDRDLDWLKSVKCIAIELHGKENEEIYLNALSKFNFISHKIGGLTFSRRE